MKRMILLFAIAVFSSHAWAGVTTRSEKITGSSIVSNAVVEVRDELYDYTLVTPQSSWNFSDQRIENRVRLRYTAADRKFYSAGWNITVNVSIDRYNAQGIQVSAPISKALSINYSPTAGTTYNDVCTYTLTGGYYSVVTVTGISMTSSLGGVMPADVMLENELEIERYYNLNLFSNPGLTSTYNSTDNTIDFKWAFIEGAEEFDLEWVYVNQNVSPLAYDFANATRVTTNTNFYRINSTYDDGYIFCRIRSVGRHGTGYAFRKEAVWQTGNGGSPLAIQDFQKIIPQTGATAVQRNWTYSAIYAEGGKRHEVLSYFDGSTRNRQSVTLNNSTNVALIQENFYDYEGRSTVLAMPAPKLLSGIYDHQLKFYSVFNRNANNAAYNKLDYDNMGMCSGLACVMGGGSGAAAYYSSGNTVAQTFGFNDYIPDAGDGGGGYYPFTRTKYNLENKVTSVSGVGLMLSQGSGHETETYDAGATQEKLDRLFGNEVGYAEHYREKATIDPNGQTTVSYMNLAGKVVATAMRGATPVNLTSFDSNEPYTTPESITEDMSGLNQYSQSSNCNVISKNFLVTNHTTAYSFSYSVTPQEFTSPCDGSDYPCKYNLTISITDECGMTIPDNNGFLNTPHAVNYIGGSNPVYSTNFTVTFPANGIYKITKSLCLDQANTQTQFNNFTSVITNPAGTPAGTGACVPPLATYSVDMSECMSCRAYAFKQADDAYFTTTGQHLDTTHIGDSQWQLFIAQYSALCIDAPKKDCQTLLDVIKTDVSPGGQYFEYYWPGTTSSNTQGTSYAAPSGGTYSITTASPGMHWIDGIVFVNMNHPGTGAVAYSTNYTSSSVSSAISAFNTAVTNYYNTSGCSTGTTCPGITGTGYSTFYDALVAEWKDCWADVLARYHPEYCRYARCVELQCGESYDYLLESLDYYSATITAFNGAPASGGNEVESPSNPSNVTSSSVLNNDPFYTQYSTSGQEPNTYCRLPSCSPVSQSYGAGASMKNAMQAEIDQCVMCSTMYNPNVYIAAPYNMAPACTMAVGNHSMWDYAQYIPTLAGTCTGGSFQVDINKQWKNFITLYETKKSQDEATIYINTPIGTPCGAPLKDNSIPQDNITDSYGVPGTNDVDVGTGYGGANVLFPDNMQILDPDPAYTGNLGGIPNLGNSNTQPGLPGGTGSGASTNCIQPASLSITYSQIYGAMNAAGTPFDFNCSTSSTTYDYVKLTVNNIPTSGSPIPSLVISPTQLGVNLGALTSGSAHCPYNNNGALLPVDQDIFLTEIKNNLLTSTTPVFTAVVDQQSHTLILQPDATTAGYLTSTYQHGANPMTLTLEAYTGAGSGSTVTMTYTFAPTFNACATTHCFCDYFNTYEMQFENDPTNGCTDVTTCMTAFINYATSQLNTLTGQSYSTSQVSWWYNNCQTYSNIYTLDGNGQSVTPSGSNSSYVLTGYTCPNNNDSCQQEGAEEASYEAQVAFNNAVAAAQAAFQAGYQNACLSNLNEKFIVTYTEAEYHYTLYYYDQAGNLTRTVPPKAVQRIPYSVYYAGNTNIIHQARLNNTGFKYPGHYRSYPGSSSNIIAGNVSNTLVTDYVYNTLEEVTRQTTPDGNGTHYWYDLLGRLRFSQTDAQYARGGTCQTCYGFYSYTLYDAQGRIIEVGENDQQGTACIIPISEGGDDPASGRYSSPGNLPSPTNPEQCPPGTIHTTVPFYWEVNVENRLFPTDNGNQVTKTYYDYPITSNTWQSQFTMDGGGQQVLRKRVSSNTFEENEDNSDLTYDHGTHFSYDIHGNVQELVQDNTMLVQIGQNYKNMKYKYDLISGKTNGISYQVGQPDQFYHKYYYDADNRLTNAFTSPDNIHWDQDARYFYYIHGPLARVELGDEKVQAMDYVYNLQGWTKAVNDNTLDATMDVGLDGTTPATGTRDYLPNQSHVHQNVARDVMGYVLDYYMGDYTSISAGNTQIAGLDGNINVSSLYLTSNTLVKDLFNGNVKGMSYGIAWPGSMTNNPSQNMARAFRYDPLNRIVKATAYTAGTGDYSNIVAAGTPSTTDYYEDFSYDPNGNIYTSNRKAYNSSGNNLDGLTYHYANTNGDNKLDYVSDANDGSFTTDLKAGQTAGNYQYYLDGNLQSDLQQQIGTITWSVYGKIRTIARNTGTKDNLEFLYDSHGNRVCKIRKPQSGGTQSHQNNWVYTFYVRDGHGNVMSVLERNYVNTSGNNFTEAVNIKEHQVYGNSRHAIRNINLQLAGAGFTNSAYGTDGTFSNVNNYALQNLTYGTTLYRALGTKSFELANHLGNVLAVVNDRKLQEANNGTDIGNNGISDYYTSEILGATDYYAFGLPMPGRNYTSGNYRYGFNGKENDKESVSTGDGTQDYGMRIYNPTLGKFLSIDPLSEAYPWLTPYQFAGNKPIMAIDLDGLENIPANPNTSPTDPNEQLNNFYEKYKQGANLIKKAAKLTKTDKYLTGLVIAIEAAMAEKQIKLAGQKRGFEDQIKLWNSLDAKSIAIKILNPPKEKGNTKESQPTSNNNNNNGVDDSPGWGGFGGGAGGAGGAGGSWDSPELDKYEKNLAEMTLKVKGIIAKKVNEFYAQLAAVESTQHNLEAVEEMLSNFTKSGEIRDEIIDMYKASKSDKEMQEYILKKILENAKKVIKPLPADE